MPRSTASSRARACKSAARLARLLLASSVATVTSALVGLAHLAGSPQDPSRQTVTLRTIVVSSADAAERIIERLNRGESFVLVAKAESSAPSAENGGWLGQVSLLQLRPDVRSALEGVTPGHLTSVVPIATGFAIFKVEEDEPSAGPPGSVAAELASAGAVKYVFDLSGFTDARVSLETLPKAADWNMDPQAICDARTQSLAATRASVEAYLSPANQATLTLRAPIDVMQLHVGLGQLDVFEGRMDAAILRFQEAHRIAAAQVPTGVLQVEEALGIAHLHKAGMDNNAYAVPGDFCLLTVPPGQPYPKVAEVEKAIEYFSRYLDRKPGDLEVRSLLNVAYMRLGGYPGKVPQRHLVPPSALQSADDVGRFRDVAPQAGLDSFASAGGVLVEDFRNTGRFDVITSTADKCGAMRMFGNNANGTFTDRTAGAGLGGQLGGLNAVHGDYNNDGCGRPVKALALGETVPDFTLTDHKSRRFALAQLRGKVVAINFMYTSCQLPEFCLRIVNHFGVLQKRFDAELGRDLMFLTITFDPARDQPEVLDRYASRWKPAPDAWRFLTGPVEAVSRVLAMFGVSAFPDDGQMDHSLRTVLIDRRGRLVANIEGNQYSSDQLADLTRSVLNERAGRQ